MKKLFTLLTLLVLLGGGKSWGQTTIFSYELPAIGETPIATYQSDMSGDLDATGGTISFGATSKFEKSTTATNGAAYKLDGDASSSNTKYVLITLSDEILQEDDIITVTGYSTNNTGYPFALCDVRAGTDKVATGTNCNKSLTASSYKVTASDCLNGNNTIYITRSTSSLYFYSISITRPAAKTVTSEVLAASYAVKVDDTALTLNASTNGYSVSGTTITLSNDITATSTPDNVELVKTITYDDASTSDADVAVTFGSTVTAGYFIGTATIGLTGSETTYTVRVKKDVTPTIALSAASGTISLNSYTPTGSQTVTLTGANLTNGTYNVTADVEGTTIEPTSFTVADGEVSQNFTITSTASSAASTVFTFGTSAMGIAAPTYTLSYSKTAQRSVSQSTVSAATTWDWTNAGDNTIELSESTSPTNADEFIMAEIAEVENDLEFNSEALKVVCQFPTRGSNHYFQGNSVKFTTSVAGVVKVWFSNTSNREDTEINRRYLYINGSNTGVYTLNQTFTTASLYVPAGEVVINAYTGEGTPAATMVRIQKIQFDDTALADADAVTVTDAGYATFVLTEDAYFDATPGVTAYAAKVNGEVIDLNEVKAAPAGTPLVIKAAAGTYTLKKATSISPAAVSTDINDLEAGPVTGDGKSHYVLGKEGSTVGFGLLANSVVLPATKAYISASKFSGGDARAFYEIDIDGISTGISKMEDVRSKKDDVYYDLQGRRVLYPTKGLYIVNGKKVIVK